MIVARLELAADGDGAHDHSSQGRAAGNRSTGGDRTAGDSEAWLHPLTVARAVRRQARELRDQLDAGQRVAVSGGDGSRQLINILAALEAGYPLLVCNGGWWPRERDAVLERLRPDRLLGLDGDLQPLPSGAVRDTNADPFSGLPAPGWEGRQLWLATAASFGEPTPFGWDEEQLLEHWLAPDGAISLGDRVVVSGEPGHAPSLRFALGALFAGASVRFVDRKALLAVLAGWRVDHLCTTPPILRRALHQLQRRQRPVMGVGRTVLHQAPWWAHEQDQWPALLAGSVQTRVSATEAGGFVLFGDQPAPGITLQLAPDNADIDPRRLTHGPTAHRPDAPAAPTPGPTSTASSALSLRPSPGSGAGGSITHGRLLIGGAAAACVGADGLRPAQGWDSGDLAALDQGAARRWQWRRRRRDVFDVDGLAVDPLEVEAVLSSHPLVSEVVVAPRPNGAGGNMVVAVVVPANPEWPPFVEDLQEVSVDLGPHCRVRALAIVDDVPLNSAGAINRRLVNYEESGR